METLYKKSIQKIVSYALLLSMVGSMLPMCVFAADETGVDESDVNTVTTSGTCGDAQVNNGEDVFWEFDADTSTLTISGSGAMVSCTASSDYPWSVAGCAADVLYLVVEEGVTSVSQSAFSSCSAMKSATVAGSVKRIEYQAFYGTWTLANLELNEGLEYIGAGNFTWNSGMTELNIPSTVTEIDTLNRINASKLTAINVAVGNTVYSSYEGALYNADGTSLLLIPCGMTSLELSSTVESFDDTIWVANNGTSQLSEVTIAEGNTNFKLYDSVIYTMYGTEIVRAPIKTKQSSITFLETLEIIGASAFSGGAYTAIDIPDSVTSIGESAFSSLANCVEVTIGEGLSTIGKVIFGSCAAIEQINYNAISLSSIVNYAPFAGCGTSETKIVIGESVENIGDYVFQGCYIGELDFSSAFSLTSLGDFAFSGTKGMTELTIPQTITSFGNGSFSGDFVNSVTVYYNATAATMSGNTHSNNTIFKGTVENVKVVIGSNVESLPNNLFGANVIAIDATQIKDTLSLVSNGVTFDYMPAGSTIYVDTAAQAAVFATEMDESFVLVLNGGTFAEDTEFTVNTFATPEQEGYTFVGWYASADFSGDVVTEPANGTTYYAKWRKDQTAITFTNENTVAVGKTSNIMVTSDENVDSDVVYSIDDTTYATLEGDVLTGVCAGVVTITATKVGDDAYNDTSATMSIFILESDADTVAQATVSGTGTITNDGVSGEDFDIVVVNTTSVDDEATFTVSSDYTQGETFHLYASVDNTVVDGATFSGTITVTIPYAVESGMTYKVLHQKQDGTIETLTATADVSAQTLSFAVSELSPFMVVSKPIETVTTSTTTTTTAEATTTSTATVAVWHAVTLSTSGSGTIAPELSDFDTVTMQEGTSYTFSINPSSGYAVSAVYVDGTNIGAVSGYTIDNIQSAHSIYAVFAATDASISTSDVTDESADQAEDDATEDAEEAVVEVIIEDEVYVLETEIVEDPELATTAAQETSSGSSALPVVGVVVAVLVLGGVGAVLVKRKFELDED